MNVVAKAESVYFSIKGQVVIPRRLRKEFDNSILFLKMR